MPRYIDADALMERLKLQYGEDLGWQCPVNMSDVGDMIEDAPTADVVEVRHGYWVDYECGECSECGNRISDIMDGESDYRSSFSIYDLVACPYCGAKMDRERSEQ